MGSNCSTCLDGRNQQPAELIILHKIHEIPWIKIGSHLWISQKVPCDSSWLYHQVFQHLHTDNLPVLRAKFSIKDIGPEFKANEFKIFAKGCDFQWQIQCSISTIQLILWNAPSKPSNAFWRQWKSTKTNTLLFLPYDLLHLMMHQHQ